MMVTVDNRREADRFCHWFVENRAYLMRVMAGTYGYDEDVLSDVFVQIYARMLSGARIKEYMPYMVKAVRYSSLSRKRKTNRLILVDNYDTFQNYGYESETDSDKFYSILDRIIN